jgi:hypothetical protein
MPFPVESKYISECESNLQVQFPESFKLKMMEMNGGEFKKGRRVFQLHPFFDKSSKKRIKRTCYHIGYETKKAHEWSGFPEDAVAIGSDGTGDLLVLRHDGDGILKDHLYLWNHETREARKIADRI